MSIALTNVKRFCRRFCALSGEDGKLYPATIFDGAILYDLLAALFAKPLLILGAKSALPVAGAAIAITAFPMLARIIYARGLSHTLLGTLSLCRQGLLTTIRQYGSPVRFGCATGPGLVITTIGVTPV